MLRIDVTDEDGTRRTVRFEQRSVAIGRDAQCELVLADHRVSRRHARLELVAGRCRVADLGSTLGTRVNGSTVTDAELAPPDRLTVGPFELVVHVEHYDPREADLVASLVERHDDGAGLVYADWLESEGDLARAEFLRLQEASVELTERRVELAGRIDAGWRMVVGRVPIEGCRLADRSQCPRDWRALVTTDRPYIRRCNACHKTVTYCATTAEARTLVLSHATPVVIDVALVRNPGDLDTPMLHANPPPPGWRPR